MELEKFEKAAMIQSEIELHMSNRNALMSYDVDNGCFIYFGNPKYRNCRISVTKAFHEKILEYIEQITEERIAELKQQFKEL